jgi:hypothetical protein
MPLQPHSPPSFFRKCFIFLRRSRGYAVYLISPEAYLLTELGLIRAFTLNKNENKSGQRPAGKRGPGSFACGWKDFSGLMFGYSKVK